ncbi:MAG: hypothetical protein B0W54_09975, partial [Cellvibrio sp. 79]
ILHNHVFTNGTQSANDTFYLHTDHLGSVEATTNALGQFVNRMSFGAWGERQKSDWKPGNPTESFLTSNGFTGHDQVDQYNLVHMGGRVYDPNLGRFLSADLFIQSPYDTQSFNRYSYTFNNPLSYTDPTGYSSKGTTGSMCSPTSTPCGGYDEVFVRGTRNGLTGWNMDNFIRDQIAQSSQTELLLMYGDVGSITAINGTAFFGVTNAVTGVGRGDEAQQDADTAAAEKMLGATVFLGVKLVGPGGKAKSAKALATGDAAKAAKRVLSKEEKAVKDAAGKGNNITVKTQKEAEQILEKMRPNIPWSETYGPKTKVGKEIHPVDGSGNAPGLDYELPHIKWRDWSGGKSSGAEGHIYFESVNGKF